MGLDAWGVKLKNNDKWRIAFGMILLLNLMS